MVYDYGYGIHTDNLDFRKGAVAELIRRYGDESFRTELDDYIRENKDTETQEEAEEAFVSGYEPTGDEGYGEIGCIVRLLSTTPNPKIWHGFRFDGEFLYYPSRFPESPTDRAKIPTETDIEESIRCLINSATTDSDLEFDYGFADDDC